MYRLFVSIPMFMVKKERLRFFINGSFCIFSMTTVIVMYERRIDKLVVSSLMISQAVVPGSQSDVTCPDHSG